MFFTSRLKFLIFLGVCCLSLKLGFLQSSIPSTEEENHLQSIAEDIRLFRFSLAEEQITKLADNQKIAKIIYYVYQSTPINVILEFARALTRIDLSFYVLQALKNEMKANGLNDPLKMISLLRAFEFNVLSLKNKDNKIGEESKVIVNEIMADIKQTSKEILTTAMMSNHYMGNPLVESLADAIFNLAYDVSDEIMREMVNKTFPAVSVFRIAETIMSSSKYVPQQVSVLLALYELLERTNGLNTEAVIQIASYVRGLKLHTNNYFNLLPHQKYKVNMMIGRMPTCAKNLFFAGDLCIWSRGRSEYLYASSLQNNASQRRAYTSPASALKTLEGSWAVESSRSVFYFISQTYKKDYLDVSANKNDWQTRYVTTSEAVGRFVETSSPWKVELIGEYCFIKNEYFKEYLFTSDRMHNNVQRYVYTAASYEGINPLDFQWQIRNCN